MKLCLATGKGAQLEELAALSSAWQNERVFWLLESGARVRGRVHAPARFVASPRNPFLFPLYAVQTLQILRREEPDVVIGLGGPVALLPCLLAKLMGKAVVYIESFSRVHRPSLTARILYRFADLVLVQWSDLLDALPKAEHPGSVF